MRHDQSFSIRLPSEILHRLEARLERTKNCPTRQPGAPDNISAAIRHVLKIGLDVLDRGPAAEGWFLDQFGPTIANMIALAATDEDAARLLKKIAARPKPKPVAEIDFG